MPSLLLIALGRFIRHCEEPFDAPFGGAQDKLPLRGSDAAIQRAFETAPDCFATPAMAEWISL